MTGINRDRLLLATTAATTSFVFFGTLVDEQRGVIPFLTGRIPLRTRLSAVSQVGLFTSCLPLIGTPVIIASYSSAIISFCTAYAHPHQLIRRLAFASGIFSLILAPLTFGQGITKINSELFSISKMNDGQIEEKGDRVDGLLKTWEKKHFWRFISYGGSWLAAFAALVLDGTI